MSTAASTKPVIVGVDDSPPSRVADWAEPGRARGAHLAGPSSWPRLGGHGLPDVPMPLAYLEWQESRAQTVG